MSADNSRRQGLYLEDDVVDGVQLRPHRRRVNHAVRDSLNYIQSLLLLSPPTKHPPPEPLSGDEEWRGQGLFFTLRVLFWDVAVSLGDTVTDMAQAATLLADGKEGF